MHRISQYLAIEKQAEALTATIDPRTTEFHSSALEALFMSNNPEAQELIDPSGENVTRRLGEMNDTRKLVVSAIRAILSREPNDEEVKRLTDWFGRQKSDRSTTASQLVWALATSAEFRFNH